MKSQLLFTLFLLITLLVGCKKDESNPTSSNNNQIYGKWQVTSGDERSKYIIFKNDNTWYILEENNYKFKDIESGVCQISEGQINFGETIMNYSITGNELKLSNTENTIISQRNDSAPDETQWIKSYSIQDSINAPTDQITDIAFDGQNIWYGNAYTTIKQLYKINILSKNVTTIPTTNYAWAVEWDGSYLWCSSNGFEGINKVNPSNGNDIFSSIALGAWIYGIAFDGQYLWCYSGNEQTLYKYNPQSNSIVTNISNLTYADGMTYSGGFLYIVSGNIINKCSLSPFQSVEAYQLKGVSPYGITFDGSNFWISATRGSYPNYSYKIYKINLN